MIKKVFLVFLCLVISACSNSSIIIPDISLVDESTAKTLLAQKTLIPNVQYEFSDTVNEGLVIKSIPEIGATAKPDDKIVIYISKGRKKITTLDSTMTGNDSRDDYEFYAPYIEDGYFVIETEFKFHKKYELSYFEKNGGKGFGRASISDTFDKVVPLIIETEDKILDPSKLEKMTIKIPVNDLDVKKPTNLYFELNFEGKKYKMSIIASW